MAPSGGGTGTGDWKTDGQQLLFLVLLYFLIFVFVLFYVYTFIHVL